MKSPLGNLLSIAAGTLFLAGSAAAVPSFNPGDLAVAFYSVSSGGAVGPDTLIVNIGAGSIYRESSARGVSVTTVNSAVTSADIGQDLSDTFGPDWAESGTVRWMVVGSVRSALTSGDPMRTAYISRSWNTLAPGTTGAGSSAPTLSTTNTGAFVTDVDNFLKAVNTSVAGTSPGTPSTNPNAIVIPSDNVSSVSSFMNSPNQGLFFNVNVDPRQTLNAGQSGIGTGIEGALDIYRILYTTSGADLTAAQATGNATVGTGQFIGSLTLDTAGLLKIGVTPPATGNYAQWATTNGITGGMSGDSDGDGIPNILEYAVQSNLTGFDATIGTFTGGVISFNKRAAAAANGDVTYGIEVSTDLGISNPWAPVAASTNTTSVIGYTLPTTGPRLFARLKVTPAAP